MPRKPSFDRQEVLDTVAELFRQHGYDGTSMRDVQRATGLSPTSLYAAFGSKDGLFDAALQSYRDQAMATIGSMVGDPTDGLIAIERYLSAMAQSCCPKHGCLLGRVLSDGPSTDKAGRIISEAFDHLESVLQQALTAARDSGDLPANVHIELLAQSIQAMSFGIQIQARRGIAAAALQAMADLVMASLDDPNSALLHTSCS